MLFILQATRETSLSGTHTHISILLRGCHPRDIFSTFPYISGSPQKSLTNSSHLCTSFPWVIHVENQRRSWHTWTARWWTRPSSSRFNKPGRTKLLSRAGRDLQSQKSFNTTIKTTFSVEKRFHMPSLCNVFIYVRVSDKSCERTMSLRDKANTYVYETWRMFWFDFSSQVVNFQGLSSGLSPGPPKTNVILREINRKIEFLLFSNTYI